MSLDQYRSRINGSVWKGLAQSGVDLSQFPSEKQNQLVDAVTNQVLLAVNDMLDDLPGAPGVKAAAANPSDEETVLWHGRPFLSLVESYTLTSERIKVSTGLLGKDLENYELIRIQDLDVSQHLSERMLNLGDIHITGADPSTPQLVLRNIPDPKAVFEILRKAWLAARRKYGLLFREEM
ncbi:MAG: PH domain-containing protein [Anaerolineaceae bacterium]